MLIKKFKIKFRIIYQEKVFIYKEYPKEWMT